MSVSGNEFLFSYRVVGRQHILSDSLDRNLFLAKVEEVKQPSKLDEMAKAKANDTDYDLYVRGEDNKIYHLSIPRGTCRFKNTLDDFDIKFLSRHSGVEIHLVGYKKPPLDGVFSTSTLLYVEGQKVSD